MVLHLEPAVPTVDSDKKGKRELPLFVNPGAGNEARTRDLNLGKVALYQLSYSRRSLHFDYFADVLASSFCRLAEAGSICRFRLSWQARLIQSGLLDAGRTAPDRLATTGRAF